jgi:hypothetical protein
VTKSVRDASLRPLSREEAEAVWRRAAELQQRARDQSVDEPPSGALVRPVSEVPQDHDGLAVVDITRIAGEVGIDEAHVAAAVRELRGGVLDVATPPRDPVARLLLGTDERILLRSRVVQAPVEKVLHVLGRVAVAHPFLLEMSEGPRVHPLQGGALHYKIPPMSEDPSGYRWMYLRYGVGVEHVAITIASRGAAESEVCVRGSLQRGRRNNVIAAAVVGALVAATATAVALTPLGLPLAALIGTTTTGVLGVSWGPTYRWSKRRAERELDEFLAAIDTGLYALEVFGEVPTRAATPTTGRNADAALVFPAVTGD